MDTNTLTAITGGLTFLGIVASIVRQYLAEKAKERRDILQRQWEKEDREAKALELAETLKRETERLEAGSKQRSLAVLDKIQENTDVSVKAFNEANNVNDKLLKIHERIDNKPVVVVVPTPPNPTTTL